MVEFSGTRIRVRRTDQKSQKAFWRDEAVIISIIVIIKRGYRLLWCLPT